MLLSELLTPNPHCIEPAAELAEAVELMDRHDIRHLPVVEGGELIGIISDRDLLAATAWKPSSLVREPEESPGQVRDLMRPRPIVAQGGEAASAVARRMIENRIHAVPILEGGRIVGIVTDYDFLVEYARAGRAHRLMERDNPLVTECMTWSVSKVERRTPIAEAFSQFRRADVLHLPVMDGERLVGIVSDRDFRLGIGRGTSTALPVQAICSREVVTVTDGQRLVDAADLMVLHKIGAVLVARGETLLGLVSSTDVLAICATLHP